MTGGVNFAPPHFSLKAHSARVKYGFEKLKNISRKIFSKTT